MTAAASDRADDDIRQIIVDTDTGIDDAMALLYLHGHERAEVVAITSVYGNTDVESALINIGRVLRIAGRKDVLVARGAQNPIEGTAHIAAHVHGRDGLGDLTPGRFPPADATNLSPLPAAELIVELARSRPGHYDLLALAPLTNIGLALELEPDLFALLRSVVVMAGSGAFPALGEYQMVDPNVQNDPIAAERVFTAPRNELIAVGVDVTGSAVIDEKAVERLRASGSAAGEFSAEILESYMDFYRYAWGRRVSPAHDGLAAAILLQPALVTEWRTGPIRVLSDGFAIRGRLMQTADRHAPAWEFDAAPDSRVASAIDYPAFLEEFLGVLTGFSSSARR
ncbi:nucleoside hydrolase [Naasia lichenicola]|uniref:Nucleoside hydrolase n=1 Tax=Naasia lichenicola TaxID=2565933 RepID=A0A4S4FER9_9MICO|nr:nucleoside hydrolase [Naasia lichenicola]THG28660.1 nucleoside hydrolase [Naasia lichenicola]